MTHEIVIDTDGTVRFVYSDDLIELRKMLGEGTIKRAGFVEPNEKGEWTVDMSPLLPLTDGPFLYREDALKAERAYVEAFLRL